MGKYNLNSSSDMRRFENDLKKQIVEKTKTAAMGRQI